MYKVVCFAYNNFADVSNCLPEVGRNGSSTLKMRILLRLHQALKLGDSYNYDTVHTCAVYTICFKYNYFR